MTATTTPPADTATASATSLRSGSVAGWAVRRALLGLLILTLTVGGSAWLLHASIEPTAELQDVVTDDRKV